MRHKFKDYLMNVLAEFNLVKAMPLQPTPEDVMELQDIDWLIEETEEHILEMEKLELEFRETKWRQE